MKSKFRIIEKIFDDRTEYYPQIEKDEKWYSLSTLLSDKKSAESIIKKYKEGKLWIDFEEPNEENYYYY